MKLAAEMDSNPTTMLSRCVYLMSCSGSGGRSYDGLVCGVSLQFVVLAAAERIIYWGGGALHT